MFKTRNIYVAAFLIVNNHGQPEVKPSKDRGDYYDFYFSGNVETITAAVRAYNSGGMVSAHAYNCTVRDLKGLVLEKQNMTKNK